MPLQKIEIEIDVPDGRRVTNVRFEDPRDDGDEYYGDLILELEPIPPTYRTATSSDFGKPVEVCSGSTWYDKAANDADRILIAITTDGTFITRNSIHGGIAEFTDARVRVDSEASNTPAEPEVVNYDPDGVGKGYRLATAEDIGKYIEFSDSIGPDVIWAKSPLVAVDKAKDSPFQAVTYRWRYARVPLTPKAS